MAEEENKELVTIPVEPETIQQLEDFGQKIAVLRQKAATINVDDDTQEEFALIFLAGCKKLRDDLEAFRDSKVRPHNTYVKGVNDKAKPFSQDVEAAILETDRKCGAYVTRKEAAIQEANRLAAAKAEADRLEKERKERELREAADRAEKERERLEKEQQDREVQEALDAAAAAQKIKDDAKAAEDARRLAEELERQAKEAEATGDTATATQAAQAAESARLAEEDAKKRAEDERLAQIERDRQAEEDRKRVEAEKLKLEKQVVNNNAKADIVAAAATMSAPTLEVNSSLGARTLHSGARSSSKEVLDPQFENGSPIHSDPMGKKLMEYYQDDARIPAELKGIQRYWVLDLSRPIKDMRNGIKVPGMRLAPRRTTVNRKS